TVAEIDAQIDALRALRQEALTQTANALAELDTARRSRVRALDRSRAATSELTGRLSSLIAFFAGQRTAGPSEPGGHG
ncbi:MAG: hypothetical protein ABMB14_22600, partial [Myxococcota bacterium]